MYVCGKGGDGYGTLLPAAFEAWREGEIEKIHVVANSRSGAKLAQEKHARESRLQMELMKVAMAEAARESELAMLQRLCKSGALTGESCRP